MDKKDEAIITIDPAKTALLMLHWQNDIAAPGGKIASDMLKRLAAAHTIEHTQAVLKATRGKGMLVIFVNAGHRPGYPEMAAKPHPLAVHLVEAGVLIRGTWGAEVIDQLKPLDNEIVVYNYSSSGFCNTELDLILRNKGITDLVLTGLATNWIVESTARDGANRGYFIYTLKDCCLSINDEMHNWTLTNILPLLGVVLDSKAYITALQGQVR
jgi:nicotinamidase-related amidase